MSEAISTDKAPAASATPLRTAILEARAAAAEREDVVVELREAQQTRLELLAEELAPVIADVPREDDRFDFAISSGIQPRLWIDAVAHVTMGRDRRTYRFLRDTALGRVVLAETPDMKALAGQVTRYVAERIVERQRLLQGETGPTPTSFDAGKPRTAPVADPAPDGAPAPRRGSTVLRGLGILLLGAIAGGAATLLLAWERLAQMGISF